MRDFRELSGVFEELKLSGWRARRTTEIFLAPFAFRSFAAARIVAPVV